jgi:cell wall-active antibiotic response 4TMS protein YvqF
VVASTRDRAPAPDECAWTVVLMRPRRGLLFWGLLLIPLGAIPLLVRAGVIDATRFDAAWELWPLLLIGIGAAILIGRTRAAIVGTAVIALTLGTIGGAALASTGNWIGAITHCGPGGQTEQISRDGTFTGMASLSFDLHCGSLALTAGDESGWAVDASYRDAAPIVESSADRLSVRSANGTVNQHDDWKVRVPEAQVRELALTANAATSDFVLGHATLSRLQVDVNAGDTRITAGTGGTAGADVTVNAGRLRIETGSAPMTGSFQVNAGAIDLCVPADVGLRIETTDQLTFATNLGSAGLAHTGNVWTRDAAAGAPTIDLSVEGNAASFTLKGEGACR